MKEEKGALFLIVAVIPAILNQYFPIYSALVGGIVFIIRIVFFPPFVPVSLHWLLMIIYFIALSAIIINSILAS